jgi:DNA-binding NtrC family response regulator
MSVMRPTARGAAAKPPAHLLRLHRHSLASVLVQGGTERQRVEAALAFHEASPLRGTPFLVLDCVRGESRLSRALQSWLICESDPATVDPLRESDGGTLFLDEITNLTPSTQRLLVMLARRLDGGPAHDRRAAGPARLAAGSSEDVGEAVQRNRFSSALLDSLDKIRVELGRAGRRGAA